MRKLFLFVFLVATHSSFSQTTGIVFESAKWKDILKKAKDENKLIFFDAYTTWCGPCVKLQKQVFPDKDLGDFYNKNFINVKFDMEKGEGIALAKKYAVQVYPTLLIIDPNSEKVISHILGYKSAPQLLSFGEQAVQKANL